MPFNLTQLTHIDPRVRRDAVLQAADVDLEASLVILFEGLASTDPALIAGSAEGLGWLRMAECIPLLFPLLSHPDPWVRDRSTWSIGKIGCAATDLLLEGIENCGKEELRSRIRAASMVGKCILPHLYAFLSQGDRIHRDFAFAVLVSQRKRIQVEPLLPLLSHPHASRKIKAIELMGISGKRAAIAFLTPLLEDENPLVLRKVQIALRRLAGS